MIATTQTQTVRYAFRHGVAPFLSDRALMALAGALVREDPRLVQGDTCRPPAVHGLASEPPAQACAIGLAGWLGEGLDTTALVERFYAGVMAAAQRQGVRKLTQWFVRWFDGAELAEARRVLYGVVEEIVVERCQAAAGELVAA